MSRTIDGSYTSSQIRPIKMTPQKVQNYLNLPTITEDEEGFMLKKDEGNTRIWVSEDGQVRYQNYFDGEWLPKYDPSKPFKVR